MNTAQLNFNVVDQSFSVDEGQKGISGYMGIFKRGPIGKTDEIFSSYNQFKKAYGGVYAGSDDPLQVKRLIERGSTVRICGVRHFTTISDPTSFDATFASIKATTIATLSSALVTGQSAVMTVNGTPVTQLFSIDSSTTLRLLANTVMALYPAIIDNFYIASGVRMQYAILSGTAVLSATGTSAPTVITTTLAGFRETGGVELFTVTPKYPGADYNNLRISVLPGSNGQSGYFDLKVELTSEGDYTPEIFSNLQIVGTPTVLNSNYLADVVKGSQLINISYNDLSALTAPVIPLTNIARMNLGTDGTTPNDTDWIGDSAAKNGLHAFDGVGDIYALGAGNTNDNLAIAGAGYAASRQDLQYFHHFSNSLITTTQIVNAKTALNINTPFIEFWVGGLKVLDPLTNLTKNITAIGDILGAQAFSEKVNGAYRSFAGTQRGLMYNAYGVVNNFGGSSDLTSLNTLSNRQVNAVIASDGNIALSGNFSGQLATSHLSFNNVVRLIIYIKRNLRPLLKNYIEEPNDFPTWKEIYLSVKPTLDGLIQPRRAIFDYKWQGDQFATSLTELKINNANDVGLGKYRVKLFIKDIVSLQEFTIDIVITQSSVSFEDALSLL